MRVEGLDGALKMLRKGGDRSLIVIIFIGALSVCEDGPAYSTARYAGKSQKTLDSIHAKVVNSVSVGVVHVISYTTVILSSHQHLLCRRCLIVRKTTGTLGTERQPFTVITTSSTLECAGRVDSVEYMQETRAMWVSMEILVRPVLDSRLAGTIPTI